MLIVAGEFKMESGTRAQFFDAVAPLVGETLKEPGCAIYAFTADPDDDDLIRLYEEWDSQESLDTHFASAHMAAWRVRSAELPVVSRTVRVHEATVIATL